MVDKNIAQKLDGYKTYPAVLWLDTNTGFCHFTTISTFLIFMAYDTYLNEIRKLVKKESIRCKKSTEDKNLLLKNLKIYMKFSML